jgi:hypothetical protein
MGEVDIHPRIEFICQDYHVWSDWVTILRCCKNYSCNIEEETDEKPTEKYYLSND